MQGVMSGPIPITNWRAGLLKTDKGVMRKCIFNALKLLQHPDWNGVLAFDDFNVKLLKLKRPPAPGVSLPSRGDIGEWTDSDLALGMAWLDNMGLSVGRDTAKAAFGAVASEKIVSPVADYLRALRWDGLVRLPGLLPNYFGAPANEYTEATGQRFMVAAAARALRPGCKVDTMLVLEGKQGARKSSAIRALAGEKWFSDSALDLGHKDAYQSLHGVWLYEIAELDAFKNAATSKIKAFISKQDDKFRLPYAAADSRHARRCVFIGTTNESQYLHDHTGNRRFWPVACGMVNVELLENDRDQLWAEAVVRLEGNEPWWFERPELEAFARAQVRERESRDAWFEPVRGWLKNPMIFEGGYPKSLYPESGLTVAEIFEGALKMRAVDMDQRATQRIGTIMKWLSWERRRTRVDGIKESRYFPMTGPTRTNPE